MVILAADADEVGSGQGHAGDGCSVDSEGLEELGTVTHRLRVLDNDADAAGGRAVGYLYPVAAEVCNWMMLGVGVDFKNRKDFWGYF